MRQGRVRGRLGALAAAVSTAVVLGTMTVPAVADPVNATNGRGGVVELSDDHVHPGETLTLKGSGFTVDPLTASAGGLPVLAVKLNGDQYENGNFPWGAGGADLVDADSLPTSGGGDGYAAVAVRSNGTFEVDVTVPTDWQPTGKHFLTFLGGSLSTANPGKTLQGQSFSANFAVLDADQAWVETQTIAHAQGSTNNDKVAVKLRNFRAAAGGGQKVAFKVNGGGAVLACVQTDAQGDANAVVPLPPKADVVLPAGENTLNVLAGSACGEGPQAPARPGISTKFNVATFDITTPVHQPGSPVTVALKGFLVQNGSAGQKVALKVTSEGGYAGPVALCVATDAFGNGTGTFTLPADLPLGTYTLNALAGSACGEGSQAPGRSLQAGFEVTAPTLLATSAPTVTGKARVGATLKTTSPNWSGTPDSVKIQWRRNGKAIPGATRSSYKVTAEDLGKRLSVAHTATLGDALSDATSSDTAKVARGLLTAKKKPSIKGTAKVGKKLRATKGTWSPGSVKVKYQWLRNGKAIKKATRSTYKVKRADRRKKIQIRITAKKSGYRTTTKKSTAKKVR